MSDTYIYMYDDDDDLMKEWMKKAVRLVRRIIFNLI